jgi:filamentous hemagglutinin family protein
MMKTKFCRSFLTLTSLAIGTQAAIAQTYQPSNRTPVADNTLGTQVSGNGNNFNITGGVNKGQTLFHSFTDFSVPTNGQANFTNPVGNRDIITRVTGGVFSDINGLVNTNGANFFLINPNGIVFGTNARLNVGKAFLGSTANGIDLVDAGGRMITFGANPNSDAPLLSIAPNVLFDVSRLNMGGGNGQINNFGTLQTNNPSQYIGLIGGNVSMNGGEINAPGGRVELGGLSAVGTVGLGVDVNNRQVQFPTNVARGDVSLTNGARVDVAGAGGGDIAISARNLEILGGSVVRGGIEQGLGTPETVAGDIKLNATGKIVVGSNSLIFNDVRLNSKGQGGNITIDTGSFSLRDGAQLSSSTAGTGNAGNVTVTAKDAVSLTGRADIFSTVKAGGVGKGGTIDINAGSLSLRDGAQVISGIYGKSDLQPAGQGETGNITVTVTGAVDIAGLKDGFASAIFSDVETGTKGNGGNITIDAASVSLTNRAKLEASTAGTGNAGNVTVTAKDAVSLTSRADIFSNVKAGGVGKGGDITIDAASLSLQDGSQLQTAMLSGADPQRTGKGAAGNITVKVTGTVDLAGTKDGFTSSIFSDVETGTKGNGGNITIDAGSVFLRDGATLTASTAGTGDAGSVKLTAKNAVSLVNGDIFSRVEAGGVGKGGTIDIHATALSIQDGAQVTTSTLGKSDTEPTAGQGAAGDITVTVTGAVDIAGVKGTNPSGIRSTIGTGVVGKGGNITIDAGSFSLRDGARLSTSTAGTGNAGSVKLKAKNAVSLVNGDIFSRVEAGGVGTGGTIEIDAASLSIQDSAQVATSTIGKSDTEPTAGQGAAGNINVTVTGAVDIAGIKGTNPSGIRSTIGTGVVGKGGNITIDAGSLSLQDGAELDASTYGQGKAGDLIIKASNIKVSGLSSITADTYGTGKAGDLTIATDRLQTLDGAQISSSTHGQGDAGKLTVNATTSVEIDRERPRTSDSAPVAPGLFAQVESGATGNAGSLTLTTKKLSVSNGGKVQAATFGKGNGGNLVIKADEIYLFNSPGVNSFQLTNINAGVSFDPDRNIDSEGNPILPEGKGGNLKIDTRRLSIRDGAAITSDTISGQGGNINLNVSDYLLMRKNSQISATAGTANSGGDGGNITINSPLIIATPGNNDITANAYTGKGGNLIIKSDGLFGIQYRLKGQESPLTNDITASSQFNQQGNVNIETPGTDPGRDSTELPNTTTDASNQISQVCSADNRQNKLTVAGRGGLPPNANDPLTSDVVWQDARAASTQPTVSSATANPGKLPPPAVGWVFDGKGKVTLVAAGTQGQPTGTSVVCPQGVGK